MEWTKIQTPIEIKILDYSTINFDGSLQLGGAVLGVFITFPKGKKFNYVLQIYFSTLNNVSKYEALILNMRLSIALGIH